MPSNFTKQGTDLDSIFAPYEGGTKKSATGYQVAGADLSDRYAPIEQGAAAAATGFLVGAADLNTLFAGFGTVPHTIVGLDGKALAATDSQSSVSDTALSAFVGVHILNSGSWSVNGTNTLGAVAQPTPTSGTWMPSGAASDYDVQFDVTASGDTGYQMTNDAPAWANLATTRNVTLAIPDTVANVPAILTANASVRIRIRRTATSIVISDSTITMYVETDGVF